MDASPVELVLQVMELDEGVSIELRLGDQLLSAHWGVDAEAAAACASVAAAQYLAAGLAHTD